MDYHRIQETKGTYQGLPPSVKVPDTPLFDLWTSPSQKSFLGVVAHFIDYTGTPRTILIGLREVIGTHSGENIAEAVVGVIEDYNISHLLGYFVMDNADNNDTAVEAIIAAIRPDLDHKERRLRCTGHIINLAAQAFLSGTDQEIFEYEKGSVDSVHLKKELEALDLWRRKGPVGKLHNVVSYIRRTPQRRNKFYALPSEGDVDSEISRNLMVLQDNSTRWNSTFTSIKRALKLRHKIDVFSSGASQLREKDGPLPLADVLTLDDWLILTRIAYVLEPFETATLKLQGNNATGWGSVWQVLPTIEPLLNHLETQRDHFLNRRTFIDGRESYLPDEEEHIGSSSNAAWKKLSKYYQLTDSSHVYATSLILRPDRRLAFLKRKWSDNPEFYEAAESSLRKAWTAWVQGDSKAFVKAATTPPSETPSGPVKAVVNTIFDDWDEEDFDPMDIQLKSTGADELDAYLNNTFGFKDYKPKENLFEWWLSHEKTFPTLTAFALSILSIPAMEAECERVFSSAKILITDRRSRLQDDIIEAIECLRNWWIRNIVR